MNSTNVTNLYKKTVNSITENETTHEATAATMITQVATVQHRDHTFKSVVLHWNAEVWQTNVDEK